MNTSRHVRLILLSTLSTMVATPAFAAPTAEGATVAGAVEPGGSATADQGASVQGTAGSVSLAQIVVTATKMSRAENVQQVPIAITAYDSRQLQDKGFENLTSIAYEIPNVQLDANGTTNATANFSIRGLAVNDSIPSDQPAVGVFVDGVYMGVSAGVLFDNWDLQSIDVLRGPQGVLFGRNVTGGAVVINTREPSDTFSADAHVKIEQDPNYIVDGSVTVPVVPGKLDFKLAAYRNDDRGWFTNLYDNTRMGANHETIVRPAVRWTPVDSFDLTVRYEHGSDTGDGSVSQNHGVYSRTSFEFSEEDPGRKDALWQQAIATANWKVGFGDGKVTNIFGWRQYQARQDGDIAATRLPEPGYGNIPVFTGQFRTTQGQRSDELRYAGSFGMVDLTTGLYYFQQTIEYIEQRTFNSLLFGAPPPTLAIAGGGTGDFATEGAFINTDWHLSERWKLNVGGRYTHEWEDAQVAIERPGGASISGNYIVPVPLPSNCPAPSTATCPWPGHGSDSWSDFSPRVGLQYQPNRTTHLYVLWDRGFRSGGYNFRVTSTNVNPGPTAPEKVDNLEGGWKQEFLGGRARFNLALYDEHVDNIQRVLDVPSAAGVNQDVVNAGNARIWGGEAELAIRASRSLTLTAQAGYTRGYYTRLKYGIDSDFLYGTNPSGVVPPYTVDAMSWRMQLPRLAPWTYGVSAAYDIHAGAAGMITPMVDFNHRDKEYFTDNDEGYFNAVEMLNARITWVPERGPATFALYGQNLLNQATWGGDTILPPSPVFGYAGGSAKPTFSPLNKGRVIGLEMGFHF